MYNGNMYEFVDKVVKYVKEQHGVTLKLEITDEWELDAFKRMQEGERKKWIKTGKKSLILWNYGDGNTSGAFGVGKHLYDRLDFEEQVYKFVNEELGRKK